eukprot:snap_masked-scaffold_13-processed-gene-10.28-mRNA-1 protein AED:1.00 eAED:1.00 QI:0/0/0/0/1/1/2/0/134
MSTTVLFRRYLEFRVYHFEDLILTEHSKDEVEGLKISLVNETNTENVESVLEQSSDWKVNSFKLDDFQYFSPRDLSGNLLDNLEELYIESQEPMEYPNTFINYLPKIRELSLGLMNSLPLPEKEIKHLKVFLSV